MTFLPKLRRQTDKNLTDAASGIAGMQAEILRLRERVKELEAGQRTPGTIEACPQCHLKIEHFRVGGCGGLPSITECPIRKGSA